MEGPRLTLIRDLSTACTVNQVQEACAEFRGEVDQWIERLKKHVGSKLTGSRKSGTLLHLKHRLKGQTYVVRLNKLGRHPTKKNLYDLRIALKELWAIRRLNSS